jgi:hypothetical protein
VHSATRPVDFSHR